MQYKFKILCAAMILVLAIGSAASGEAVKLNTAEGAKETVVLLHGIGHSRLNMSGAAHVLHKAGYNTLSVSYPSRSDEIAGLSAFIAGELRGQRVWQNAEKVHFVTHSMGGLVTRQYLEAYKNEIPKRKLGRVVMMAPPLGGSEVTDFLKSFPPYKWLFGPAGLELTTEIQRKNHVKPYYDVGIIAGTSGWPYLAAHLVMPSGHDGRVSVESTKWIGMKDHITLSATHSFISWKPIVHKHIIHFINKGEFDHEA
jgi:pimeloyl-ACP methyl ester carboxylesterase